MCRQSVLYITQATKINRSIVVIDAISIEVMGQIEEAEVVSTTRKIKSRNKILFDPMVNSLDVLFADLPCNTLKIVGSIIKNVHHLK